jgi:hypothetical protein
MTAGVTVDFNANLARFTSGVDKAVSDLNKFQSNAQRISSNISRSFGALGVGLSVGGVVAYGKAIIDLGDEMNDLSQRVGINIKDLATWQLAASQSGTTMESVAKGVKGLSTYMVENGAALKKAGINATDANGAMVQLADLFKAMPDGVEKTVLAVKLFGKAGMDMIPMLNMGSEGLKEAQEKAKSYGERLAALAPKADAFNDQMAELALQSKAAGMNITDVLLPGLIGVSTWLNDLAAGGDRGATAMEFLAEKTTKFTNLIPQLRVMAELAERVGPAMALAGVGGDQSRRSRSGNIAGGAGDLAAFDAAAEAFMKERAAKLRAKGLIGNDGKDGAGGKGGRTGKPDKGPIDVFGSGSFITGDKDTADRIRASYEFENWAQGELVKDAADQVQRLNALLAATPSGQLEKAREEMQFLAAALETGAINEAQFSEAVGVHYGKVSEALDQMSEFAVEAARGIQDAFADFLFDPFDDKTGSMLDKFSTMLRKMAAQAAAAQLNEIIFGDLAKSGKVGGLAGMLAASFTSGGLSAEGKAASFTSGGLSAEGKAGLEAFGYPGYAQGTPWVPNDGLAYLHKGEQVIPAGKSAGSMSVTIVNNSRAQITQKESTGNGQRELVVMIEDVVSGMMGAGALDGPMRQNFGARRQGVLRG